MDDNSQVNIKMMRVDDNRRVFFGCFDMQEDKGISINSHGSCKNNSAWFVCFGFLHKVIHLFIIKLLTFIYFSCPAMHES